MASQFGTKQLPPDYLQYSNGDEIMTIVGLVTGLALLAVFLRTYVRVFMLSIFGLDDYLMIQSVVVLACFKEETMYGLGKHFFAAFSDMVAWEKFLVWQWVHSIIIMTANSTLKLSIAFFLMRITQRTHYRRLLWSVIVFIILFTIACFGTLLFQCVPPQAAWRYVLRPPPLGHGNARCYNTTIFRDIGVFNSSIIMATDVLFAVLPIPLILSLQLNKRQKISLIIALSLGFFSCAASLVKTVLQFNVFKNADWTVHDSFAVWFDVEVNVGIIAASLPTLKPLLKTILEPAKRALTGSAGSGNGSSFFARKKGRSASSLGYLRQQNELGTPLDSFQNRGNNGRPIGNLHDDSKTYDFQVRVTSGEILNGPDLSSVQTRDGKALSWEPERVSDESFIPLQGRIKDDEIGIMRSTEVKLGRR
ncbi:MAG: hypothetical protein M1820_001272 [Bogoriella megaspora]|nr:MAG: hypothetical protein M1820_001272 [Bogoriella megaspora]